MRGKFRMNLNEVGRGEVWIDDKDISDYVSAVHIGTSFGAVARVHLTLDAMQLDTSVEGEITFECTQHD
jgi:hypothetical protein